jgi:hypothetical protein
MRMGKAALLKNLLIRGVSRLGRMVKPTIAPSAVRALFLSA